MKKPTKKWVAQGVGNQPNARVQILRGILLQLMAGLLPLCFLCFYMHGTNISPWMTRRQAAEYLRCRVDEVDENLVPLDGYPAQVPGKMRYLVMDVEGARRVRILAADVFSVLPLAPQANFQRERPSVALRG